MARSHDLYRAICEATGREELTDAEVHKIVLFLQRRLCQPGDAADLSVSELAHLDTEGP